MTRFSARWAVAGLFSFSVLGCSCGDSTLGGPCETDRDCDRMQRCNLATMTCETDAPDAGPAPDGGGTDTGTPDPDGGSCTDADLDGVTDCAGDCDDTDPTVYPGATEVCGDGLANDCSGGPPDATCRGLGTFVAPPPLGNDANPGTQAMPVATIAQGMMNATTIGGGVDVYVAAGRYDEDITMIEGISLIGGHDATTWARDRFANVTTIANPTNAGIVFPSGITGATELDGFEVLGRSAAASTAAITIANGASPVISYNAIVGGNAGGRSRAIHVNPMGMGMGGVGSTGVPIIDGNEIFLGESAAGWGGAAGSYGIEAWQTALTVINNFITLADDANSIQQGILVVVDPAIAMPGRSTVVTNTVRGGRSEAGFGMRFIGGSTDVDTNDVHPGSCNSACIALAAAGNALVLAATNNVLLGGEGQRTAGLAIEYEVMVPAIAPDVLVHSNVLDGGMASGFSAGVWLGEHPSAQLTVGRFYDNVIRSGTGSRRFAFLEQSPNIDPELVHNNAFFVETSGMVVVSALYFDEGDVFPGMMPAIRSGTPLTDAAMINAMMGARANLQDDCSLVRPMLGGDFHLSPGSACIDAGDATEAPATDFEGDPRPRGAAPDIGVDEAS